VKKEREDEGEEIYIEEPMTFSKKKGGNKLRLGADGMPMTEAEANSSKYLDSLREKDEKPMVVVRDADTETGDGKDYDKKLKKALKQTLAEDIKMARAKLSAKRLKAKLKKKQHDSEEEEGP